MSHLHDRPRLFHCTRPFTKCTLCWPDVGRDLLDQGPKPQQGVEFSNARDEGDGTVTTDLCHRPLAVVDVSNPRLSNPSRYHIVLPHVVKEEMHPNLLMGL